MSRSPEGSRPRVTREAYKTLYRAATLINEQYMRVRYATLVKAFYQWQNEFPLVLKIEELVRQLRERSAMLEAVRGSYLKDVINVKLHMDSLMKVELPDSELERWQKSAYDLHVSPSADLRTMINKAKASMTDSSTQLRENLIDAGIVDPETCRTLNPWEQSRAYRRIERLRKGPSHRFPEGGESLHLAAPTNFKVFIRHCSQCIGVVAVVKGWNQEVEKCMRFFADNGQVDTKINEFKRLIRSLQTIIEEKEKEAIELTRKNDLLECASQWFEKWSHSQQFLAQEAQHREATTQQRHLLEMAQADKESTAFEVHCRYLDHVRDSREAMEGYERELARIQKERDIETLTRMKLNNDIQALFVEKQVLRGEVDVLTAQNTRDSATIADLTQQLRELGGRHELLQWTLRNKEEAYDEMHTRLSTENQTLSQQVAVLTQENGAKEKEVDRLREEVRSKTKLSAKYLATINRLHEEVDDLKAQLRAKAVRRRMRIAIYAVLFIVKYRRAVERQDLSLLGYMGCKYQLRIADNRCAIKDNNIADLHALVAQLQGEATALQSRFRALQTQLHELEGAHQALRGDFDSLRAVLAAKEAELAECQRTNADLQGLVEEFQRLQAAAPLPTEAPTVVAGLSAQAARRVFLMYQSQRNLVYNLTMVLFRMRCVMYNIDPLRGIQFVRREQNRCDVLFENFIALANAPASGPQQPQRGDSAELLAHSSFAGNSFVIELNSKFLSQAALRDSRPNNALAVIRGKGERIMQFIRSHKPNNVLFNNPDTLAHWLQWIDDKPSSGPSADKGRGRSRSRGGEQDQDEGEGAGGVVLDPRQPVARSLRHDNIVAHHLAENCIEDVFNMQAYVFAYRQAYGEAMERLAQLHHREVEERARRAREPPPTDKTVVSQASSGNKRQRSKVMQIKQSYAHMLESDVPGYLNSVLKAIETVQQEHGDAYGKASPGSARDDTASPSGSSISGAVVSDVPVAAPPLARAAPRRRKSTMSFTQTLPTALEVEGEGSQEALEGQTIIPLELEPAGAASQSAFAAPKEHREPVKKETPSREPQFTQRAPAIEQLSRDAENTQPVERLVAASPPADTARMALAVPPATSIPVSSSPPTAAAPAPAPVPAPAYTPAPAARSPDRTKAPKQPTKPAVSAAGASSPSPSPVSIGPSVTTSVSSSTRPVPPALATRRSQQSAVQEEASTLRAPSSPPLRPSALASQLPGGFVGATVAAVDDDIDDGASLDGEGGPGGTNAERSAQVRRFMRQLGEGSSPSVFASPPSPDPAGHIKRRETRTGRLVTLITSRTAIEAGATPTDARVSPLGPTDDLDDDLDPADPVVDEDAAEELRDLQILHGEVVALLQRDAALQQQLDDLSANNDSLRSSLDASTLQVGQLRQELNSLHVSHTALQESLGALEDALRVVRHENGLLREIVYESYQYTDKEIAVGLHQLRTQTTEQIRGLEAQLHYWENRELYRDDKSTQVNCVVCAVRDLNRAAEGDASCGLCAPAVEVRAPLTQALGGRATVLVPGKAPHSSTAWTRSSAAPDPPPVVLYARPYVEKVMEALQRTSVSLATVATGTVTATATPTHSLSVAAKSRDSGAAATTEDQQFVYAYARSLLGDSRPRSGTQRAKSSPPRPHEAAASLPLPRPVTAASAEPAASSSSKFRKLKQMPDPNAPSLRVFTAAAKAKGSREEAHSAAFLQDATYTRRMGAAQRAWSASALRPALLAPSDTLSDGLRAHRPQSARPGPAGSGHGVLEELFSDDESGHSWG